MFRFRRFPRRPIPFATPSSMPRERNAPGFAVYIDWKRIPWIGTPRKYPAIFVDGMAPDPIEIGTAATAGWGRLIATALKNHYPAIDLLRQAWTHLETSEDPRARELAKEVLAFLDLRKL
jgi:hypothetical protein